MNDPQTLEDIRRTIAGLARDDMRARGDDDGPVRLRFDAWTIERLADGTFLASWSDGVPIGAYDSHTVARGVALWRIKRGDPIPPLVN